MNQGIANRVLLIGWDAADWKMIDPLLEKGEMPNLKGLIERGVMGNVASLSPMLSPILWTSIATGKHADKHGILGFAEPDIDNNRVRPVTSTSRKCKAIWNILSEQGKKAGVVNWFASHPAEPVDGFVVTDRYPHAVGPPNEEWLGVAGSVHPAELLDEACKMRVHPAATTPAHVGVFIPKVRELDPLKDKKLHQLRVMLAQCASVQAVTTFMMQKREWDFLGVYFDTIDRFAHEFMEFHPPKMAHVSDRDFELYQHVMNEVYKFHDQMLGRMIQLAGEDTAIIILSDHGFHCDHLRPEGSAEIKDGNPVSWHRLHGMVVISGPGIKKDERVYGASLLDITPTILWLLGLPVGDDMDGNALIQIADGAPCEPEKIESYEPFEDENELTEPESSAKGEPPTDDPWAAQQMMQQLVALGYIEQDASVDGVVLDRARNLGQVYAATGRPQEAIKHYQIVLSQKPDDKGCKMAIANCHLQLNELNECERIVREVLTEKEDAPQASLYLGMIHFRRGETDKALERLLDAERANPSAPGLHCQLGNVHLGRSRWSDAQAAFEKALAIDPNNAEAHDGLGVAFRQQKRPADAVNEHMRSIALLHYRPQTHIHLGIALAEVGQIDWAIRAFNVALQQNPENPIPHRFLAQLYRRAKKNSALAATHQRHARRIRASLKDERSNTTAGT